MTTVLACLVSAFVTSLLTGWFVHSAQERKIRDINQGWRTLLDQARQEARERKR